MSNVKKLREMYENLSSEKKNSMNSQNKHQIKIEPLSEFIPSEKIKQKQEDIEIIVNSKQFEEQQICLSNINQQKQKQQYTQEIDDLVEKISPVQAHQQNIKIEKDINFEKNDIDEKNMTVQQSFNIKQEQYIKKQQNKINTIEQQRSNNQSSPQIIQQEESEKHSNCITQINGSVNFKDYDNLIEIISEIHRPQIVRERMAYTENLIRQVNNEQTELVDKYNSCQSCIFFPNQENFSKRSVKMDPEQAKTRANFIHQHIFLDEEKPMLITFTK